MSVNTTFQEVIIIIIIIIIIIDMFNVAK